MGGCGGEVGDLKEGRKRPQQHKAQKQPLHPEYTVEEMRSKAYDLSAFS